LTSLAEAVVVLEVADLVEVDEEVVVVVVVAGGKIAVVEVVD